MAPLDTLSNVVSKMTDKLTEAQAAFSTVDPSWDADRRDNEAEARRRLDRIRVKSDEFCEKYERASLRAQNASDEVKGRVFVLRTIVNRLGEYRRLGMSGRYAASIKRLDAQVSTTGA